MNWLYQFYFKAYFKHHDVYKLGERLTYPISKKCLPNKLNSNIKGHHNSTYNVTPTLTGRVYKKTRVMYPQPKAPHAKSDMERVCLYSITTLKLHVQCYTYLIV